MIAAKLARPDLPVLCLVGDGCFQTTCGEAAVEVGSAEALERELRKAFGASVPTVIEAVVDPAHYKETGFD